jgi:hypothetical protein
LLLALAPVTLTHAEAPAGKAVAAEGPAQRHYSPYAFRTYPDRVLFGDMHVHTNLSPDAGLVGTTLTVEDAYRAARGETVTSSTGLPFRLVRPLDFLVVTDHAEYIGLAPMIQQSNPILLSNPHGKWLWENFNAGPEGARKAFASILQDAATATDRLGESDMVPTIWREFVETADRFNDPGVFSAMTGFEWTSMPNGNNLHRVVVFADGADKTRQVLPFSLLDSQDPEDLWVYLQGYEQKTGGRALAHVHNGNLSNGQAFSTTRFNGEPIDAAYAQARVRWEPIMEITQIKGDGETHPFLSPDDEFADFERWDVSNLTGSAPKENWMLQYEYGRSALKVGLELEEKLGTNPYRFGFNASSDTHTALPSTGEENFFGKFFGTEPTAERFDGDAIPAVDESMQITKAQESASGLTGVWASVNSRDAIFDALRRKEIFATSGTRIRVRLFAGWDFAAGDEHVADIAGLGYGKGVPMGGELRGHKQGEAPTFLVQAMRDPDWANLDRVQVIKGWLDSDGSLKERIYDVAVSGNRTIDKDGRAREPVGNTVDIASASFRNSIGAPMLFAFWEDPDFDPTERAFYYVRVLEIPTPRWTTYDAEFFGIDPPDNVPATVQDRAYTSAVWYSPEK